MSEKPKWSDPTPRELERARKVALLKPSSGMGERLGVSGRFITSAIFGCFVSFVIFCVVGRADPELLVTGVVAHSFWVTPLVWGVLGIFWFDPLLRAANTVVEWMAGRRS